MFLIHASITRGFVRMVLASMERTVCGATAVDLLTARRWRSRTGWCSAASVSLTKSNWWMYERILTGWVGLGGCRFIEDC